MRWNTEHPSGETLLVVFEHCKANQVHVSLQLDHVMITRLYSITHGGYKSFTHHALFTRNRLEM